MVGFEPWIFDIGSVCSANCGTTIALHSYQKKSGIGPSSKIDSLERSFPRLRWPRSWWRPRGWWPTAWRRSWRTPRARSSGTWTRSGWSGTGWRRTRRRGPGTATTGRKVSWTGKYLSLVRHSRLVVRAMVEVNLLAQSTYNCEIMGSNPFCRKNAF